MKFEKVSKEAFIKDCFKYAYSYSVLDPLDFLTMDELTELKNKLPSTPAFEDFNIPKDKIEEYLGKIYDNISIPKRSTSGSAGYDFKLPFERALVFDTPVFIPTGIRVHLDKDKILAIAPRSSSSKNYLALGNTIGIIDSDYVNADNEGDIIIAVRRYANNFSYAPFVIKENEKIAQGIILPFYTVEDDDATGVRTGGFGSTGK